MFKILLISVFCAFSLVQAQSTEETPSPDIPLVRAARGIRQWRRNNNTPLNQRWYGWQPQNYGGYFPYNIWQPLCSSYNVQNYWKTGGYDPYNFQNIMSRMCLPGNRDSTTTQTAWTSACGPSGTRNGFSLISSNYDRNIELLRLICTKMQLYYLDEVEKSTCTMAFYKGFSKDLIDQIKSAVCKK
ncbi:unnamed protein product [Caenorhabditis auriculariae]|uniref:Uncharacterized protein n=1 Tax=Caenorhabditis auriculariae TaxID=2777116 RepID=A0A8S1H7P1_9PELO|nr:unnamed protein product [Caenorhabditis auriculariae]